MKAPALPGLSCSTNAMIGHRSVTVHSWTRIPVFVLGPRAEVAGVGLDRFILEVGRVQDGIGMPLDMIRLRVTYRLGGTYLWPWPGLSFRVHRPAFV